MRERPRNPRRSLETSFKSCGRDAIVWLAIVWLANLWLANVCGIDCGSLIPPSRVHAQDAEATVSGQAKSHTEHPENRLAKESSPYLLQHARNPIDWYPWGEEAFERARKENKMVFLSVGYAACHWCHVMERESFVDAEIAKLMNERFVCVKVDREERPDVDQIYMLAVQLIAGQGGWPMSVFMTPDSKPFWGGSYFPARDGDRGNLPGFLTVLRQIDQAWQSNPDAVRAQATLVTDAIQQQMDASSDSEQPAALPTSIDIDRVARTIVDQFDPEFGGFGFSPENESQPKFPEPSKLLFLLDRATRESVSQADRDTFRAMLTRTLDAMLSGAMWDHLGGGFHRYSVDRRWAIPHFEKMLYDNAQLAIVYSRAYELTGREEYRNIAGRTCDFVKREFTASSVGDGVGDDDHVGDHGNHPFYSSLDADSEGEEGTFYRWTVAELDEAKKRVDGYDTLAAVYRLDATPNFEETFFVPSPGKTLTAVSEDRETTFTELDEQLRSMRVALFAERAKRERPATDTKVLTAWNGLMIAALAETGRVLDRPDDVRASASAAEFLLAHMIGEDGQLRRSYADGHAKLHAYLEDYAMLASGLIELHRTTGESRWLESARELTDIQLQHFWDEKRGGFFFTSDDQTALIVRFKDPLDNAMPSATSITLENLVYLASTASDKPELANRYKTKLEETMRSVTPMFRRAPGAVPRAAVVAAGQLDSVN